MSDDPKLERLEHQIGRVLQVGVIVSATALACGLVLTVAGLARPATILLKTGLVVLIAIPATRIIASWVDALRRRDVLLASATSIVLAVLVILFVILAHR